MNIHDIRSRRWVCLWVNRPSETDPTQGRAARSRTALVLARRLIENVVVFTESSLSTALGLATVQGNIWCQSWTFCLRNKLVWLANLGPRQVNCRMGPKSDERRGVLCDDIGVDKRVRPGAVKRRRQPAGAGRIAAHAM